MKLSQKRLAEMSPRITRNSIFIGLFIFILLIVIPFMLGGLAGIGIALLLFAFIAGLSRLLHPKWNFLSKALLIIGMAIILFVVIYFFFLPHTPWLPVP